MLKRRILLLLILVAPFFGRATHIVGGEFELIRIQGFEYRLNLVLYFDQINGNPRALDQSVNARIYSMANNAFMMNVFLPLISESDVNYTQPACSNGELVTRRLLYSAVVTLSGTIFKDPAGYYVSWERCCRNYNISNILSDPPSPNGSGNYAGQTFYLEFPPVVKDGQPFVDSTPRLFPPLNDFACPHRPYYTDFGGIDDDGDSLVYSIVTPLSTRTGLAFPVPGPKPYPNVTWRAPYSLTNILSGAPDLRISTDGFLTVTPTTQGLFVFAVKVEEYRNHQKIGETRRDFQMLVVDACPIAEPPQILGKKLNDVTYTYDEAMDVVFANTVADADRCIRVRVSDPDSESIHDNFEERVNIKAIALNFKKNVSEVLPAVTNATLINGSTIEYTICFPKCPYFVGGSPVIGIVAMDDACSLPLTDTLKVSVFVVPPPNTKPRFTSPNPITATLPEGTQQAWPYSVVDDDGDPLVISVTTNGFSLGNAGMTFNTFNQTNGAADGQLLWNAYCDIYDFTQRTNFQVTIRVEDQDLCLIPDPAKALHNLTVTLPDNSDPIIDSNLTPSVMERTVHITRRINEQLGFTVTGKDVSDYLVLSSAGNGFAFEAKQVMISPMPATGLAEVSSTFQWDIKCETVDLDQQDTFEFQFIVVDNANKCRIYKADTLDVNVKILPPVNQAPVLGVLNNNPNVNLAGNVISMTLGGSIDLLLTGTDGDVTPVKDALTIGLTSAVGNVPPSGFTFEPVEGKSPVSTAFTWTPNCSIFKNGVYENEYTFTFHLDDDHCLTAKKDSLVLTIRVKDVDGSDAGFHPPNFVSPNGDDKNDYYAMEMLVPETGELENILPQDNCASRFEYVRIYNRWGKEVFQSSERNFRWYPDETSAGVYFYNMKFSTKEYRGSLTVSY